MGAGYRLKDGERVFHKKHPNSTGYLDAYKDGYMGTFRRFGEGFNDWEIIWDDDHAKKILGKHPDVKMGADWLGGFEWMSAELKPKYDALLIKLKKYQIAKQEIYPHNNSIRCVETTSGWWRKNDTYHVKRNSDWEFFLQINNRYMERIRPADDGYTWVWLEANKPDRPFTYAVFENERVKDFMLEYKEILKKRATQQRFGL